MTTGEQIYKYLSKSFDKIPFIITSKNLLKSQTYKEPMLGTVNIQDHDKGNGTHWVGFLIPSSGEHNYYFDSFGLPPPTEIANFLKQKNRKVIYTDQQIQNINSDTCGEFVVDWLLYMKKHILKPKLLKSKFVDFIYKVYGITDLENNDKIVKNRIRLR